MNLEEPGQQRPRRLRHVRPSAVFDLRQVRLADALAQLLVNGFYHLLLRHGTSEAAQRAFHLAQVTYFLSQFHIPDRYMYIAICNACQETDLACFEELAAAPRTAFGESAGYASVLA